MIRRFVIAFLVLCLPSLAFGQNFNVVVDSSLYPLIGSGDPIPPNSDYALLKWELKPSLYSSTRRYVIAADIVPSLPKDSRLRRGGYGYSYTLTDDDISVIYSVISPSNLYWYLSGNNYYAPEIQNILASKNLGTVQQRAAYIAGLKVKDVNIVDTAQIMQNFQDLLGPWATIAVGFAIALFCLELGTRNTKQLAGDAAKEARASDRRVLNREIRDDPIASQFRAHMDNLASVMRNTYGFHDASTRAQARDLFEQAARDYASYKKSRGWTV